MRFVPRLFVVLAAVALVMGSLSHIAAGAHPRELPVFTTTSSSSSVAEIPYSLTLGSAVTGTVFMPLVARDPGFFNPRPADGAVEQSPNAYLVWQFANDQIPDPSFAVYLEAGDSTPDTLLASDLKRRSLDPDTFALDTVYYWRVVATGSNGKKAQSPVWSFRTEGPFDPAKVGSMVTVPAGEFLMGCDYANDGTSCNYKDTPLHAVWLDSFQIDKYEVTNGQYQACVDAGACPPPRRNNSHTRDAYFRNPAYAHYPVLYVSRWDGDRYCAWVGKRLPTEAEWEKAARGVIDTRRWPWGNEPIDCSRLNYTNDSIEPWLSCVGDTVRVGSYPTGASPYGAMDMGGNVFEWVSDRYDEYYYSQAPYVNPLGPEWDEDDDHLYFTIRGGSYRPRFTYPRTFHRHFGHHGDSVGGDSPYYRNDQVGFRCARSLPKN